MPDGPWRSVHRGVIMYRIPIVLAVVLACVGCVAGHLRTAEGDQLWIARFSPADLSLKDFKIVAGSTTRPVTVAIGSVEDKINPELIKAITVGLVTGMKVAGGL